MGDVRLNKLLAERGAGARRKCDALIQSGEVRVDGRVVTEPGTQVDPATQRVTWRGRPLPKAPGPVYLMINKPGGMLTTLHDPEGRRTVLSLLPPRPRLFPVGRLDAATTGLLIATNDGALAHRLMHPRYGVPKVYRMTLAHRPSQEQLARMEQGVRLDGAQWTAPARVRARGRRGDHYVVDLAVHEGRYHLVRQMCEALGLRLLHLHRVAYGPLRLRELKVGRARPLTPDEVRRLRASAKKPRDPPPRGWAARAQLGPRSAAVPGASHHDGPARPRGAGRSAGRAEPGEHRVTAAQDVRPSVPAGPSWGTRPPRRRRRAGQRRRSVRPPRSRA